MRFQTCYLNMKTKFMYIRFSLPLLSSDSFALLAGKPLIVSFFCNLKDLINSSFKPIPHEVEILLSLLLPFVALAFAVVHVDDRLLLPLNDSNISAVSMTSESTLCCSSDAFSSEASLLIASSGLDGVVVDSLLSTPLSTTPSARWWLISVADADAKGKSMEMISSLVGDSSTSNSDSTENKWVYKLILEMLKD